jgi:hypothetical protein
MSAKFILPKDAIKTLRKHGLAGEVESGRHFKIRFVNANGSRCILVMSRTPSCKFAIKRNRAVLRRLMRRPAR